jgi:predicted acyltransferase (DUF342 family)
MRRPAQRRRHRCRHHRQRLQGGQRRRVVLVQPEPADERQRHLQTTGANNINIADIKTSNLAISGGTLTAGGNFKMGNQVQTISANVNAATMNIGSGSDTKITGTLTATGQITLGSHATIIGPISASVVTTTSPVSLTGDVTASSSFSWPPAAP